VLHGLLDRDVLAAAADDDRQFRLGVNASVGPSSAGSAALWPTSADEGLTNIAGVAGPT